MSAGQSLKDTLEERGGKYGDFRVMAAHAQALKQVLVTPKMSDVQKEAMGLICTKLARIACGDSEHRDSWLDIAGYANLVVFDLDRPEQEVYDRGVGPEPSNRRTENESAKLHSGAVSRG